MNEETLVHLTTRLTVLEGKLEQISLAINHVAKQQEEEKKKLEKLEFKTNGGE